MGFTDALPVSAIHGDGFLNVLDKIGEKFPTTPQEAQTEDEKEIRIAIIGQPNAGKSSLLNRILGEERSVVSPIAGTTADPVDSLISWRGTHRVRIIDTAGIRRRANDRLARAAVIWALRVVQRSHVVILVIDATTGVTEHDVHLASFVLEHNKSIILAVNKWDLFPKLKRNLEQEKPKREKLSHYQWNLYARELYEKTAEQREQELKEMEQEDGELEETPTKSRKKLPPVPIMPMSKSAKRPLEEEELYEETVRKQLQFMPYAPVFFISATTGYRVPSLMDLAVDVFQERGKRLKTQELMEVISTSSLRHKLPTKGRNLLRVKFATQATAYPPTFIFFVNNPDSVPQHYQKFLESCIREKYRFVGTPVRIVFKKSTNKYVDQKKPK